MEDGNAYRIELGTVGWERCWGAVTWTPVHQLSTSLDDLVERKIQGLHTGVLRYPVSFYAKVFRIPWQRMRAYSLTHQLFAAYTT
jgi:hypothetical protein